MGDGMQDRRIVVVGAGAMGRAAIEALLAVDVTVTCVDASPDVRTQLNRELQSDIDSAALRVLDSTSAVQSEHGTTALLFLPTERAIGAVLAPDGRYRSIGAVDTLVDFGTNSAGFAREMARLAAESGVSYLDAPVLGRPDKVGKWVVPIGGASDAHERTAWILDVVAVNAPYVGPAGSGVTLKLLNQLMFGAINSAAAEIAAVADAAGIDKRIFFETVTGSSAATVSSLFTDIGKRIIADDYTSPTFTLDLLAKDVGLAHDLAQSVGVPAPLIAEIVASTDRARDKGMGQMDTAAAWLSLRGITSTHERKSH